MVGKVFFLFRKFLQKKPTDVFLSAIYKNKLQAIFSIFFSQKKKKNGTQRVEFIIFLSLLIKYGNNAFDEGGQEINVIPLRKQ